VHTHTHRESERESVRETRKERGANDSICTSTVCKGLPTAK
jgi:hypothetical protein